MGGSRPVYGIEEEVFVLEEGRPTVRSLYYLARLLWSDPCWYYTHSASNFNRGTDLRYGLMSGIEVSTGRHDSIAALVQDLAERRRDLARACQGLLCPLGNLPDHTQPSNTCGLHLHISGVEWDLAYRRLVRYLPAFALALAHAPWAGGRRFGQSFRWAHSYALGPLRPDPTYRFQDLIRSRRLGTLEVRVFDPSPDLGRLAEVLGCLHRLLVLPAGDTPADRADEDGLRAQYNHLRYQVARLRSPDHPHRELPLADCVRHLRELTGFDENWVARTPADETAALLQETGREATYLTLDARYRQWAGATPWNGKRAPFLAGAIAGFIGYYLPRLPYTLWKAWREWS